MYEVKTRFTFEGVFKVIADSDAGARRSVEQDCGMVTGNIHTSLCDDEVDWEFPVHPEKQIIRIKRIDRKVKSGSKTVTL